METIDESAGTRTLKAPFFYGQVVQVRTWLAGEGMSERDHWLAGRAGACAARWQDGQLVGWDVRIILGWVDGVAMAGTVQVGPDGASDYLRAVAR